MKKDKIIIVGNIRMTHEKLSSLNLKEVIHIHDPEELEKAENKTKLIVYPTLRVTQVNNRAERRRRKKKRR